MKKEQILKILKKYGFYSLNRAPYLYENNDMCGVYFVWPSKHYGNLERVLFFNDEESLEDEIYKYWWFLNHKKEIEVSVIFDNYEALSPKVTYYFKDTELSSALMKNFHLEENNIVDEQILFKKEQLFRTANILLLLLREKLRVQHSFYLQVLDLQENLKRLIIDFKKKLNLYNKTTENVSETCELLRDDTDESDKFIQTLKEELSSVDKILDIKNFISKILSCLKSIDLNEIHLQNLYLFNRFPIEIEDMNKKIGILDEALLKKKKLKSKKSIELLLKEIDDQSPCLKLIDMKSYIKEEKGKLEKRYDDFQLLDETILGDHLLSLESFSIEVPKKLEKAVSIITNPEFLFTELKNIYEKLSKEEQAACHIATSFLSECLNQLMSINSIYELSVKDIISQLELKKQSTRFNDAYQYLDHYLNVKLRLNYFSILKMDSIEVFIESLVRTIKILNQIMMKINYTFVGYHNTKEKNIIPIHLKRICYLEQNQSYIAHFMANTFLYYSPVQIVKPLDVLEFAELEVKESETVFILKNKVKIDTKSEKVFVTRYKKNKVMKKDDFTVIIDMDGNKKCEYYEEIVSSLESE